MKNKTTWEITKELISHKKIGEIITRRELVKKVYSDMKNIPMTLDGYRKELCHAGYLKSVRAGVFEKLKDIEEDLTTVELRKKAYPL